MLVRPLALGGREPGRFERCSSRSPRSLSSNERAIVAARENARASQRAVKPPKLIQSQNSIAIRLGWHAAAWGNPKCPASWLYAVRTALGYEFYSCVVGGRLWCCIVDCLTTSRDGRNLAAMYLHHVDSCAPTHSKASSELSRSVRLVRLWLSSHRVARKVWSGRGRGCFDGGVDDGHLMDAA